VSTTRNSTVRRSVRERAVYLGKALARRVFWAPSDLSHRLRGDRLPPRGLSFVGHGDFEAVGREFAGYFRDLGGLAPGDRVLDMGCGIGRMAIPLTEYLEDGSYAGFDVGRAMIRWCRRHITPAHREFEFSWAPVYNGKYNPFGTLSAAEYRFPYESATFDFAFATSLFTHLLREDARHYVTESARVLKPGGTCFFTFFLLTPEAKREVAAGRAMPFAHPVEGGGSILDPREPELGVAYPLEDVRGMLAEAGLELSEPVHPGLWANAPDGVTLQDIVIARRSTT
jgi:SAM-dependent methyltransferase